MTDFRALCADLVKELEGWQCYASPDGPNAEVLGRARAALSEPELERLTDERLIRVYQTAYQPAWERGEHFGCHVDGLRAVFNLALWGK